MLLLNSLSSETRLAMMKMDDYMKLGDINIKENRILSMKKLGGFEVCN